MRFRSLYPDVEEYPGASHRSGRRIDQLYYKGAGLRNTSTRVISTRPGGFPSDHFMILSTFDLDYSTPRGVADRRSSPCAPHPFAEEKAMPMISRALILLAAMIALPGPVHGQGAAAPYKVYDTRPVITEGPYLIATGETTATIVWFTDTPSHAKVRYGLGGDLSAVAEPQVDGLVPVGTRHVVHLEGLLPGTTYSYEVCGDPGRETECVLAGQRVGRSERTASVHDIRSSRARPFPSVSSRTRMRIPGGSTR